MSIPFTYPAELPCPTSTSVQRKERRFLGELPGPRTSRPFSYDKVSTQPVEFLFRTQALLQTWLDWYHEVLSDGAAWFTADWAQPEGGSGARRFIGALSYPEFILPKQMWRVQATCQIRGRGLAPLSDADPYWQKVILHLNGDDLSNFARDWSPHGFATTLSSLPTLDTTRQKYGSGCIDLSGGGVIVDTDTVYQALMGADEFTLQWWTFVLSYPLNPNNRIALFGPFSLDISAAGQANCSVEINDLSGGGRTAFGPTCGVGLFPVGEWVHMAVTRTNALPGAPSHSQIDGFVNGVLQAPSSQFSSANPVSTDSGFRQVGVGTTALIDDFQLTAGVNRYRGLSSFTPPGKLATF